ncbi:DUF1071 domain-containing protein [Fructobacillus tropaeoli]|uniref:Prophage pi2 protein 11, topoisomerase n=1 Tax=Fructobacillus tropaeoli TaxID=709323 RepID=A0A3F3HIM6_9LACO|nr:DUF1071 domain-containing protein [Fructobacillus tropaeoli]GAP05013.1 prophage pi2 protein 11, topoisomerase [Fructobacillus tropaeoli]
MTEKSVFKTLSEIDVSDHVDKKGNFNYLSWPWAISEVMKNYPDTTYEVKEAEDGGYLFGNPQRGYSVKTSVTIQGRTLGMWLPVMDMRNKSLMKPTSTDENKAVMRCLVKNLAMFGLGLYIYAGEDLPDVEPEKVSEEQVNILKITISNAEKLTGATLTKYVNEHLNVSNLNSLTVNDYPRAEALVNDLLERAKAKAERTDKEEETA